MDAYTTGGSGLSSSGGDVVADNGATIISSRSQGDDATLFGSAALREIQAGVANGDFAITPQDPLATISDDNNLPYWSYTDVNSGGKITCALVANATTASGYVLRWSVVGDGTLITGKSATMTRYVPIAGSRNRSFAYAAEAHLLTGGSSTTACSLTLSMGYVTSAYAATGSTISEAVTFTDVALGLTFVQVPQWDLLAPDLTEWLSVTVPADAAYLKITMTVSTNATVSGGTKTIDCAEVRMMSAGAGLILPDLNAPATGAGAMWQDDGRITIAPVMSTTDGTYSRLELDTGIYMTAPLGVEITSDGSALGTLYASDVHDTTGDLQLIAEGGDVILRHGVTSSTAPRLLFRDGAGTYYGGIQMTGTNSFRFYNGSTTNDYGYLLAERIYPMNGTTASSYIYHDGTRLSIGGGGGFDASGTVYASGAMVSDAISTTTQTASAAIWVLSSGTTYSLRRNSSSARYKTEIEDVDAVVLEAARRIRPRHYRSTIADEDGATRLGFIAEEVEAAGLTHAVGYDADGRPESLDTTALIAALYARVDHLERRLAALEAASR